MDQAQIRKLWIQYWTEHDKLESKYGFDHLSLHHLLPEYLEEFRDLACGAKTRAGTPCKRKDIYGSGRCKFHGGLSTGPRTVEGKKRSSMNGFKPKKKRTL